MKTLLKKETPAGLTAVWYLPLAENRFDAFEMDRLSPNDRARFDRMARAEEKRRFLGGRVLMRRVLEELTGESVAELEISSGEGKPKLRKPALPLDFSISHSGDLVAVAVSAGGAVGLDVELKDETAAEAISAGFSGDDLARLNAVSCTNDGEYSPLQLWTEKEAYIKFLDAKEPIEAADVTSEDLSSVSLQTWELPLANQAYLVTLALPL